MYYECEIVACLADRIYQFLNNEKNTFYNGPDFFSKGRNYKNRGTSKRISELKEGQSKGTFLILGAF